MITNPNKHVWSILQDLYLLVKHETDLPESAANGVESQGLDEGVRASEIIEQSRNCLASVNLPGTKCECGADLSWTPKQVTACGNCDLQ